MATQFRLTSNGREWLATVDGTTVTIDGIEGTFTLVERADGRWAVSHADDIVVACGVRTTTGAWTGAHTTAREWHVEANSGRARHRAAHDDGLRAPMSATVVKVHVSVGDAVDEGDALVVVEAMKMEMPIRAPRTGVVTALFCAEGDLVQPDLILVELGEPGD